jgi:nitroreductase
MMLAAHSLGLGSCWVGFGSMVTDVPEVRALLELKGGDEIFGPILLGYPKANTPRPPKKDPKVNWV